MNKYSQFTGSTHPPSLLDPLMSKLYCISNNVVWIGIVGSSSRTYDVNYTNWEKTPYQAHVNRASHYNWKDHFIGELKR